MSCHKIILTKELARAAAMDAANRNMREAGREVWNIDDYNVAVRALEHLLTSFILGNNEL